MSVRLPAEWERQSAVMLTWPHPGGDWGAMLQPVYRTFAAIGAAVTAGQQLLSVCATPAHHQTVREALAAADADPQRLRFAIAPSNDAWARDHGPLVTLGDSGPVINDFGFNGWGGKFEAADDDRITRRLHHQGVFGSAPRKLPGMVLEGGAIETDGLGTLLATRRSVIDPARNPQMDQAAIETVLAEHLGIRRFLWLDQGGLSGDDTDGHIDTLVRFADAKTLAYQSVSADHPDRAALDAMAEELRDLRQADGNPYRLVRLPCPGRQVDDDGRPLPASYANFLVTNAHVLMPSYGSPNDGEAASVLSRLFPGRPVVSIDCRAIIRQNGSLHCLTMQFPEGLAPHPTPIDQDR
ncbi:MAG: agmatine deiminase family protein [Chromatiaceae bacterium]|jgi:agmatine/peptidylarginine deiminase